MSDVESRLNKFEQEIKQDMKALSKSTNENTMAIREMSLAIKTFCELTVLRFEDKIKACEEKLGDHELRIRANTKFVYQALAISSVIATAIGYLMRFIK